MLCLRSLYLNRIETHNAWRRRSCSSISAPCLPGCLQPQAEHVVFEGCIRKGVVLPNAWRRACSWTLTQYLAECLQMTGRTWHHIQVVSKAACGNGMRHSVIKHKGSPKACHEPWLHPRRRCWPACGLKEERDSRRSHAWVCTFPDDDTRVLKMYAAGLGLITGRCGARLIIRLVHEVTMEH